MEHVLIGIDMAHDEFFGRNFEMREAERLQREWSAVRDFQISDGRASSTRNDEGSLQPLKLEVLQIVVVSAKVE